MTPTLTSLGKAAPQTKFLEAMGSPVRYCLSAQLPNSRLLF